MCWMLLLPLQTRCGDVADLQSLKRQGTKLKIKYELDRSDHSPDKCASPGWVPENRRAARLLLSCSLASVASSPQQGGRAQQGAPPPYSTNLCDMLLLVPHEDKATMNAPYTSSKPSHPVDQHARTPPFSRGIIDRLARAGQQRSCYLFSAALSASLFACAHSRKVGPWYTVSVSGRRSSCALKSRQYCHITPMSTAQQQGEYEVKQMRSCTIMTGSPLCKQQCWFLSPGMQLQETKCQAPRSIKSTSVKLSLRPATAANPHSLAHPQPP